MTDFTHLDQDGRVRMVDVADKGMTKRVAVARGCVTMTGDTLARIMDATVKKGNVLRGGPHCRGHGRQKNSGSHSHVSSPELDPCKRGFFP